VHSPKIKRSEENLIKQDVESILDLSNQITSLPALFNQINEAVEDPECSLLDIGKLISGDSVLSARLLKLANSSFFGFPSQIETVIHAVTIIGMAQIRDLVLAAMVTSRFKAIPRELIDMKSFWFHSIACGLTARVLATYRHETNVERFYVMGMFHNLGRLLFYLNFTNPIQEILLRVKKNKESLHKLERNIIGCDHAELGGALLKRWNLPKSLSEPVFCQNDLSKSTHYPVEAAILHVADIIANALMLGDSGDPFVPPLDSNAWEKIDLPVSLLPAIVNQVDRQFPGATEMFFPEE
jgi:HD-like signal output (HDOD) protein